MNKVVGGSAGTLCGLAATVYFSANPSWATNHPHLAQLIYFSFATSLLFLGLQFGLVQRLLGVQPHLSSVDARNASGNANNRISSPGRDNTGNLYHVQGKTVNFSTSINKPIIPADDPSTAPASKDLQRMAASISIESIEAAPLTQFASHVFQPNTKGETAAIIWIENCPPGEILYDVSVSLKFKHNGRLLSQVNRAFWIN